MKGTNTWSYAPYKPLLTDVGDFEFDGEDIIYLCRTGINGASDFHDTNYSTFHRIKNFRK